MKVTLILAPIAVAALVVGLALSASGSSSRVSVANLQRDLGSAVEASLAEQGYAEEVTEVDCTEGNTDEYFECEVWESQPELDEQYSIGYSATVEPSGCWHAEYNEGHFGSPEEDVEGCN